MPSLVSFIYAEGNSPITTEKNYFELEGGIQETQVSNLWLYENWTSPLFNGYINNS